MTGSFGELGSLLKQAQQMQRDLDRVRDELRARTVEGSAGGGAVRVTLTGDRQVAKVEISDDAARAGDRARLEELVANALRDALAKSAKMSAEAFGKVTGGLSLPGLF